MICVICTDISGIGEAAYEALYEKASHQRRCRAEHYRKREDALRCLTADALLQFALGTEHYSEEKAPDGKPYIRERMDFHYNLSHSGRWVVLAYGDEELGVDVEEIRPDTDIASIAGRFFSEEEQKYIREDPAQSRPRFFEVWTAKESYIKFLGTGLKTDMTSFSVFSLPQKMRCYRRKLDEECYLSLCTMQNDYVLQMLDIQTLL